MRPRHYLLIAGLTLLLVSLGLSVSAAGASAPAPGVAVRSYAPPAAGQNDACLACHQNQQMSVTLGPQKSEVLSLFVDSAEFNHSVHGDQGLACVDCHIGFQPANGHGLTFGSRRDVTLTLNKACAKCHQQQADLEKDSVHAAARAVGTLEAAICTDCHTAHAVRRLKDPNTGQFLPETRFWIPTTCRQCHSEIYAKYRNSVHGKALIDGNNRDVPTCIDCHGVHQIVNPTTDAFRLKSPQLCAKCHTDPAVMDKYSISTQVLNTYVADFHGTTVTIFQKVSPDSVTNKPVCFDCHGIHDIARVDDPQKGLEIKANIIAACQKCHPDANTNFPDAWLSHYIPSPTKYPLVYYINLFYKFFIPAVLLPMAALVVMDFGRMLINRFKKPKPSSIHVSSTEKPKDTDEEAHYDD